MIAEALALFIWRWAIWTAATAMLAALRRSERSYIRFIVSVTFSKSAADNSMS